MSTPVYSWEIEEKRENGKRGSPVARQSRVSEGRVGGVKKENARPWRRRKKIRLGTSQPEARTFIFFFCWLWSLTFPAALADVPGSPECEGHVLCGKGRPIESGGGATFDLPARPPQRPPPPSPR